MTLYWQDIRQITEAELLAWFSQMSPQRQQETARRQKADRRRTAAGEHLARQAVAAFRGMPESEVVFQRTAKGKPYVDGGPFFSISHSADLVLCAVDKAPIGADVQVFRPVGAHLVRRVCVPEELSFVEGGAPLPERLTEAGALERFFFLWTAKEAWCKYTGASLAHLSDINTLACHDGFSFVRFRRENYAVAVCAEK